MRIGYIVLSHRDWRQVARLARVIRRLDPSAEIVVSHDVSDTEGAARLRSVHELTLLTHRGGRADFSAIERWRAAVDALAEAGDVDFVVLLSGQDQLAVHPDRIKADLAASGDGRMEQFDVLDPIACPWRAGEGRSRYRFRWRTLSSLGPRSARVLRLLHVINKVQPLVRVNVAYGALRIGVPSSGLPSGYRVTGGSQWHALSWRAVQSVCAQMDALPELTTWGSQSLVSDEAFIQTLVSHDPALQVSQGAMRYFDFSATKSGHPRTLALEDLDAIVGSGAWFARKVDWSSSRPLIEEFERRLGVGPEADQ